MSSNILLTMKPLNSKRRFWIATYISGTLFRIFKNGMIICSCLCMLRCQTLWNLFQYQDYLFILLLVSCIREWPLFLVDWDMLFGGLGRGVAFTVPLRWIWYKNKLFTLKSQWQQISIFRHALLYGFFYVFNNFLYWDHNWKCKYLQVKD